MAAASESPLLSNLRDMYVFSDQEGSVKKIMEHYDKDHDGILDAKEFSMMCYDLGVTLSEEEAEACVHLMDRDGDGKVVFDEVKEWWASSSNIFRFSDEKFVIAQFAIGLFRFYDIDRKGYITRDEYEAGVAVLKEAGHEQYAAWVDRTFEEYDVVDVDGWVTMNEFMKHIVELYFPEHDKDEAERANERQ